MVGVERWTYGAEAVAKVTVYAPRSQGCAACDVGAQAVANALGAGAEVIGGVYDKETDCYRAEVTWTWALEVEETPEEPEEPTVTLFAKCGSVTMTGLQKVEVKENRDLLPQFAIGTSKLVAWTNGPVQYRITVTQENPTDTLETNGFTLQVLMDHKFMFFSNCVWEEITWQRSESGQIRMAKALSYAKSEEAATEDAV